MRGQVMERPFVAARMHRAKRRGLLGLIRIGALLERKSELDLTNDQLKQLLSIRADSIRSKAKITGDIRVARLELIYYVASNIGDINPDQVRSSLKNIYAMRLERKAVTIDAFKKASGVLTSEQKDKLHDMAFERLSEFEDSEDDFSFGGED